MEEHIVEHVRWPARQWGNRARVVGYRLARRTYQRVLNRSYWQHRQQQARLYGRFLRRGDLAFDVGACHGAVTDVLLGLGCRVVAVEPNPMQAALVRWRYGVPVVEAALGDREGTAVLSLGHDPGHSTISDEWRERAPTRNRWGDEVRVRLTTLGALEREYGVPVFVKIDVEGHEAKVLAGASQIPRSLSFEYQSAYLDGAREAIELLRGHRFAFTRFEQAELSTDWMDAREATAWLARFGAEYPDGYGDAFSICKAPARS